MGAVGSKGVQRTAPERAMQAARDAALAGGWRPGTMLRSPSWLGRTRVEKIDHLGGEVQLRSFREGGSTVRWVRSVPEKVYVVGQRVQASRVKGSKLPAGVVCVSHGKWGSPYRLEDYKVHEFDGTREELRVIQAAHALRDFEAALHCDQLDITEDDVRRELAGKDLACWCNLDHDCHADVLLRICNEEA